MNAQLAENIDWVGHVDWTVRDFHGYRTSRGSTYNAYLVRDKKTALIDTVKAPFVKNLLCKVSGLTELAKIDYVVCNHAEPDHSGGLPEVMNACVNAELVCDAKCKKALEMHYETEGWTWKIVAEGDSLSLGNRTLTFIETPLVHWPESMFTYIPEDKILFSMDAFGQHYSSGNRFDDEEPMDVIMAEAKKYYANIVMCYGKQIARVLDKAAGLDIEMIAPSHGIIWRSHIADIINAYKDWVVCKPSPKALIIYDTMWKSTELMAEAVTRGALTVSGVQSMMMSVRSSDITDIATEVLDAAAIAIGSPTLNMTIMPATAGMLAYLKGLKPAGKAGFAFGSYGWVKSGPLAVHKSLEEMKFEILREPLCVQFVPSHDVLKECYESGRLLGEKALAIASAND